MNENGGSHDAKWAVLAGLLAIPSFAWTGLVVSILWRWFVVPLGVDPVSAWQGSGLALIVGLMTPDLDPSTESRERFIRTAGLAALLPPMVLAIGWLFHAAMVVGGAP